MINFDRKKYPIYASFLNQLAKDLTQFYNSKLNRTFKVSNKLKGKGYDPVTTSDRAFEKLYAQRLKKNFLHTKLLAKNMVQQVLKVIILG